MHNQSPTVKQLLRIRAMMDEATERQIAPQHVKNARFYLTKYIATSNEDFIRLARNEIRGANNLRAINW